jgi:hypothetical protein
VGVEEESVIQNIVELANEGGLEDVHDGDVEELLQFHSEILSSDELRELAEQRIQSESEAFDIEEETPVMRDLTAEFLSSSITAIMQSWTSSSIMTLTRSEAIRQNEVFLA